MDLSTRKDVDYFLKIFNNRICAAVYYEDKLYFGKTHFDCLKQIKDCIDYGENSNGAFLHITNDSRKINIICDNNLNHVEDENYMFDTLDDVFGEYSFEYVE